MQKAHELIVTLAGNGAEPMKRFSGEGHKVNTMRT